MLVIGTWPCPAPDGNEVHELVLSHNSGSDERILIIPPLFAEHNLMRRQLAEVMRRLADAQIDSFLPDMPGCNESLQPMGEQSLSSLREAMAAAARHHKATRILAVRSGGLLVPSGVPAFIYAWQSGTKLLRGMIRARLLASREAGLDETSDALHHKGRSEGLVLAGWTLSARMFEELESAQRPVIDQFVEIAQSDIGGSGIWLRAEPDEDSEQAAALAEFISSHIRDTEGSNG